MPRLPRRRRVLAVDDHPDIRRLIRDILSPLNYDVEGVASVRRALRRLEEGRYAGVVTDYRMPGLTGLDLITRMRKAGRRTPVVLITGVVDEEVEAWVAAHPTVTLLHKPFTPRALARALASSMKK